MLKCWSTPQRSFISSSIAAFIRSAGLSIICANSKTALVAIFLKVAPFDLIFVRFL